MNNSPSLRVLVVDDEPLIRWSLSEALADAGHSVVEAGDAGAVVQTLSSGTFDVVLLDYRLPDSNDLDLLAAVRRLSPSSAVVMMTAFGTPEVVQSAIGLGAYRVVPKPFEVQEMVDLVREAHASTGR